MIIGEVTEPVKVKRVFAAPEAEPTQDSLPDLSTTMEMLTFTDLGTEMAETETETQVPEQSLDVTEETVISSEAPPSTTGASGLLYEADVPYDVHSKTYSRERTVIAGGVIGLLFAIFLILLLVYRMRKKKRGATSSGTQGP
ncbi:syndecan-2-like [Oncorhynchus masou masou]|uniref:syndecan-2-like n=1 Tax=Oncorhynchus masou masou TaxID=90313 RepID=UPI00318408FA